MRLAWFATARGTSSLLLFTRAQDAIRQGALDAEIVVVFCNRERGQSSNTDAFLGSVEAAEVPAVTISSGAWRKRVGGAISTPGQTLQPWRRDFDQAVRDAIAPYQPDLAMLAGYMLITTPVLCDWIPFLNLHPAEPGGPVGTWQEVIRTLINSEAQISGLMLQRITTNLDRGPIITACRYGIRGSTFNPLWAARSGPAMDGEPLFHAIRNAGVERESLFIVESLCAIAGGAVPLPGPHAPGPATDISATVEAALAAE